MIRELLNLILSNRSYSIKNRRSCSLANEDFFVFLENFKKNNPNITIVDETIEQLFDAYKNCKLDLTSKSFEEFLRKN